MKAHLNDCASPDHLMNSVVITTSAMRSGLASIKA